MHFTTVTYHVTINKTGTVYYMHCQGDIPHMSLSEQNKEFFLFFFLFLSGKQWRLCSESRSSTSTFFMLPLCISPLYCNNGGNNNPVVTLTMYAKERKRTSMKSWIVFPGLQCIFELLHDVMLNIVHGKYSTWGMHFKSLITVAPAKPFPLLLTMKSPKYKVKDTGLEA